MVREAIKRYVEAAQSLTEVPRERAERIASRLAGSGMIDPSQIRSVAGDLVERSRENRRRVTDLVAREIRRQVSRLGLASKDDIERLGRRVQALEVSDRRRRSESPPRRAAAKKKAPAKAKAASRKRPASKRS
jgi:polyhydroxyalkanoate synthesis regulator phasin